MPGNYSITGDLIYDWKKYFDVSCENDTIPTWNQVYRMYLPLKSKDYERNRYSPKVFFGRKVYHPKCWTISICLIVFFYVLYLSTQKGLQTDLSFIRKTCVSRYFSDNFTPIGSVKLKHLLSPIEFDLLAHISHFRVGNKSIQKPELWSWAMCFFATKNRTKTYLTNSGNLPPNPLPGIQNCHEIRKDPALQVRRVSRRLIPG